MDFGKLLRGGLGMDFCVSLDVIPGHLLSMTIPKTAGAAFVLTIGGIEVVCVPSYIASGRTLGVTLGVTFDVTFG